MIKKTLVVFMMKHNPKITALLLVMFLVTQFIGLYVVNHYQAEEEDLPYGLETPDPETQSDFYKILSQILIAFIIAVTLLFLLTQFKVEIILRIWFFLVILIALAISFNSFFPEFRYVSLIALLVALPLTIAKIFGRDIIIHNFTELLIYPGIAAIFVPILNVVTIIIFLLLISVYDAWAVWHSGIMQKMAKYQIDKLKIFSGFFVPYVSKKVRMKLKKMKKSELRKKKVRVNVAILGGGDVIFPIITAGVMLKTLGLIPAIFVIIGATLGLSYLMLFAEKKKFYPAMPYISAGIFAGIALSYLVF